MTILKILNDPYEIFEGWKLMDVLVDNGKIVYECSIAEPLITEVRNAKLPYQVQKGNFQTKIDFQ